MRFLELDFLRGTAVFGMIVFHAFFILDFYGVYANNMFLGWWHVLGQFVRFLFLMLVGISMVVSFNRSGSYLRQVKRGLVVFAMAMSITFVTFFAVPGQFVFFGILHLIAFSMILLTFFVTKPFFALIASIIVIFFGYSVKQGPVVLFFNSGVSSLDYFPLFPWLGLVAFGIFLGHFFYRDNKARFKLSFLKFTPLNFLGRHSLLIYMIHVPLLVLFFVILQAVDPSKVF